MLRRMTTSHDGAPEPAAPGRRRPGPPAAAGFQDTVSALVRSSDVPLAAVALPSGQLLAVNPMLAELLGATVGELTGSSSLQWLSADDRQAARLGFQALADGDLTGYQAVRRLARASDTDQALSVWVSTVEVGGTRVGLASAVPPASYDNQFRALPPVSQVPEPGNVVLGTVDGNWRIDRVSQDVTALLGLTPEQAAGQPVLAVIHPSDLPAFLAAVEHARRGQRAVRVTLRLGARSADWIEVAVVLAIIGPGDPPPLAFALMRDDAVEPSGAADSAREMRLEGHMLRIADELHAAGLIPRLQQLPALAAEPRLGKLTSREWAVLTRLLDGQRIPAIAASLYVSQSTVRNHLSSIYAKLGVHSQVDLIRLIRRGTKPPAAGG